jgi:Arc/MetJ family transcription regulator
MDDQTRKGLEEGLGKVAQSFLDQRDSRAAREEVGLPLSERLRKDGQRKEADKRAAAQTAEFRMQQERFRKEDERHEKALAERRQAVEDARREALNEALKNSLRQRYLAAGGTESEFQRALPALLEKYRMEAVLGRDSQDPKEELAAYFRGRGLGKVPE